LINNESESKSFIGGIFTIIYKIIAIAYTIYVGLKFVLRQEMNFIYNTKVEQEKPFIDLSSFEFNVSFGLQYNNNSNSIVSSYSKYFNHSIILNIWTGNDTQEEKYLDLEFCSPEDFNQNLQKYYSNNLSEYYCLRSNNEYNISLDGSYTDSYYKFLVFEVSLTDYALENSEEVIEFMENNPIEMAMYFTDTAIDYKSRKHPLPLYLNYLTKRLDYNFLKETEVFISKLTFENDENILFYNSKLIEKVKFDRTEDSFNIYEKRNNSNNIICRFVLKASSNVIQLQREYQKFPEFYACLRDLLDLVLLFMELFISFLEKTYLNKKLTQRMLKYKDSKYYYVNYLNTTFRENELDTYLNNIIHNDKLSIVKKGGFFSRRNSVNQNLINRKMTFDKKLFDIRNELNKIREEEEDEEEEEKSFSSSQNEKKKSIKSLNLSNNRNGINIENSNIFNIVIEEEKPSFKSEEVNKRILSNLSNLSSNRGMIETNNMESINIELENKNSIDDKNESFNDNINNINLNIQTESSLNNENDIKKGKEIKEKKKDDFNYGKLQYYNIIISKFFCCSKKMKKINKFYEKATDKIYTYLDIYNYIQRMQEIDLLKYSLFDEEQLILFNYLSIPPIRKDENNLGIYNKFECGQIFRSKIGKNDMDTLINTYKKIGEKNDVTFEDIKLMRLVNAEINFLK